MRSLLLLLAALPLCAQPSTRSMEEINWLEFRDTVPKRIDTVLLPTGTIEPHGVANNGADITAPVALAKELAPRLNAMIAPVIPYGVTGRLDAYPGAFSISEEAYRLYVTDVLNGLARNKFKHIIILNGHGGPQTAILESLADQVGRAKNVKIMVTNWWSICSDVTLKVFGEDGGHAGWNETAMVQAVDPKLVHPERYRPNLATPRPPAATWNTYPFPSSIILYQPGQGYPKFDQAKAQEYYRAVVEKMHGLIQDVITKWKEIDGE